MLNLSASSSSGNVVTRNIGSVTLGGNARLNLAVASTHTTRQLLVVPALNLSGSPGSWSSLVDLSNNDLIERGGGATGLANVFSQVQQGFAGGSWLGTGGITSSAAAADSTYLTALGVIQNDDGSNTSTPIYSTFDGTTVGDSDLLLKYTYYGDSNLDGAVDGSDYSLIDNGYLNQLTGWFNGDFNYDGVVDGSDYTLIDNAFNSQASQLTDLLASPNAYVTSQVTGSSESSSVPEPAAVGILVSSLCLSLRRRRSRC